MAYFIDPELEALATGRRHPAQVSPRTSPEAARNAGGRKPNKFGKKCHGCGCWVNAGGGYLANQHGGWVVYCSTCP